MIRPKDLWNYLRGDKKGKVAHRLEQVALSDPFLYEALEGLSSVEGDHEKVVDALQRRILHREVSGARLFRLRWMAAASMVVLGGIAWVLTTRQESLETQQWTRNELVIADSVQTKSEGIAVGAALENDKPGRHAAEEKTGETQQQKMAVKEIRKVEVATDKTEPIIWQRAGGLSKMLEEKNVLPDSVVRTEKKTTGAVAGTCRTVATPELPRKHIKVMDNAKTAAALRKKMKRLGGNTEWQEKFNCYVADSLRYPKDAKLKKLEGEVSLVVRLNRRGHPSRIKILQSLSPSCDREAIRLVETYPGPLGVSEKEITLTIFFNL